MKTWTVDEVRKVIAGFAGYSVTHHGIGAELMDIAEAFAERIKAGESAVPTASYECPICRNNSPHTHDVHEVEVARLEGIRQRAIGVWDSQGVIASMNRRKAHLAGMRAVLAALVPPAQPSTSQAEVRCQSCNAKNVDVVLICKNKSCGDYALSQYLREGEAS